MNEVHSNLKSARNKTTQICQLVNAVWRRGRILMVDQRFPAFVGIRCWAFETLIFSETPPTESFHTNVDYLLSSQCTW